MQVSFKSKEVELCNLVNEMIQFFELEPRAMEGEKMFWGEGEQAVK